MVVCQSCTTLTPNPTATAPIPTITTPTKVSYSKSEQIQLVDGALDACLLLKTIDVENILGIKVRTTPTIMKGATACKYVTDDKQQPVLIIYIFTDATLQSAGMKYTAAFWFEQTKKIFIEMNIGKMEDLVEISDQAYYREASLNYVDILKNQIYYEFNASQLGVGGLVPKDKLIALAKVAIQRAP